MKPIFFISLSFLLMLSTGSSAQSKHKRSKAPSQDTLAMVQQFLKVCNSYKQLPIRMDVEILNSTDFITGREDTAHYQAAFCIRKEGSYISYGEMEQIADDSVVLLVSNRLKRMILYAHPQSLTDRFAQYLSFQLQDSSVLRAAAIYSAAWAPAGNDTSCIIMTSRHCLLHTALPDGTIQVKYNTSDLQPFELVQLRRRLIPVSATVYAGLAAQQKDPQPSAPKLLSIGDSSFFVIKEQTSVFRYRDISHKQEDRLPVRISDRIVADVSGKYSPAPGYGSFLLTRQ